MMHLIQRCCAVAALLTLAAFSSSVYADGRNWNDGPVVNVSAIRTVDGHFDDYMQWLATTWKQQEEAAKKAGLILSYDVLVAEARTPQDPDIFLVVRFKNWAALDSLGGKLDAISAQVEGSVEKANQSEVARGKIRTILGSQTMQVAELK
ncbi:MAG TPA: hypothetical protein VKB72_07085 [Steroidobacteraceae bacterium]|nr:hypothetical protein [Steroidobacteraceae bacterium]